MSSAAPKFESDFDFLRRLVHERSAIVLEANQSYLLEARLGPVAHKAGIPTVSELLRRLRAERFGPLHRAAVEAMTTNETFFFRDLAPFQALQKVVIPSILANNAACRQLSVWCAAASSGQEPYSVAMTLREHFPQLAQWKIELHATDLSDEMMERVRSGSYSQLEVNRGLPAQMLIKYFQRSGVRWTVKPELVSLLTVRKVNLIDPWPNFPLLDVVFLRNVLIYFDVETKKKVLARMKRVLRPGGFLFLGGAETPSGLEDDFERVNFANASCYQLRAPEAK